MIWISVVWAFKEFEVKKTSLFVSRIWVFSCARAASIVAVVMTIKGCLVLPM